MRGNIWFEKEKERFLKIACVVTAVMMLVFWGSVTARAEIASGTCGTCSWVIDDEGVMIISPTNGESGQLGSYAAYMYWPWNNYRSRIKKVVVTSGVSTGTQCRYMFYNFSSCTEMDVSNLDTNRLLDMDSMFANCTNLTFLDLSGFDTSGVTNMNYAFKDCQRLESIDLSSFRTDNVRSMKSVFYNCRMLTSLDLTEFKTGNVTDMLGMFYSCKSLKKIDLTSWDTHSVENFGYFFADSGIESTDVSTFDFSSANDMHSFFSGCSSLKTINLGDPNTVNVTNMNSMFSGCEELTGIDVTCLDISNVTDIAGMFADCKQLKTLDVSGFNTQNVTTMQGLFSGCEQLSSIDVSLFNTSNVENMSGMFDGCSSLETIDVSSFDTKNVTNMSNMFQGCTTITHLDLSAFDTRKVTTMRQMFYRTNSLLELNISSFDTSIVGDMYLMFSNFSNCVLNKVVLGPAYSFKGEGVAARYQTQLPTPGQPSTKKWVREDNEYGPFTPVELLENYGENASAWAGTWVWDIPLSSAIIFFDANGGYTEQQMISQTAPFSEITFPETTRPAYYIVGWNTERDGTGESYSVGAHYTPTEGNKTFYAQWAVAPTYQVNHYQQKVSLDGYDLVQSETLYGIPEEQSTPEVKTYDGFISPSAQTVTVASDSSSEVDYYYDRTQYTIHFNGNEATTGTVLDQPMVGGITRRLNDNKFKKDGYAFTGWNTAADGSGTAYGDAQTVVNLAENGQTVTLYAQWLDVSNADTEPTDGTFTIRLKAGQTANLPNLPAGVHYEVTEVDNPNGWSEESSENTIGTISSNETSSAKIKNKYEATGSVNLVAYKKMSVGDLSIGEFSFELKQGSTVLQTVSNGDPDLQEEVLDQNSEDTKKNPYYGLSTITFDPITFTAPGSYTYTISEVIGLENDVKYDTHTETVIVTVTDNYDGTLTCTPTYDTDGPVFENSRIPVFEYPDKTGRLLVRKTAQNESSRQSFDFIVNLTDNNGIGLTESYLVDIVKSGKEDGYKDGEVVTASAVSHTQNINDLGEKQSNYGNSWNNSHIRGTGRDAADSKAHVVTIPGAEELQVVIVYGGESSSYDWVCAWQGSHPDYTAYSNYASSFTGKLGGGSYTATSNTKEYDVPGDTVTFSYRSDAGIVGDGYGYYAVVTARVANYEYTDDYVSSTTVTNGGTVSITDGQTAVIEGLPNGVQFSVEESSKAGYELIASEGTSGTIAEDSDSIASFTNVYSASGSVQFALTKTLAEGSLDDHTFTFNLLDSTGAVLQSVQNAADGSITFTPIDYTEQDAGNRYSYSVVEVIGDDPLMRYDDHIEDITVEVSDNGDGTLNADAVYYGSRTFSNAVIVDFDVPIEKKDILGGRVPGAVLTITGTETKSGEDIQPIEVTTASDSGQVVTLKAGTYTLTETTTPAGYETADPISFTVEADGTIKVDGSPVTEIEMTDDYIPHEVPISKVDLGGNEIAGATLTVTGREAGTEEDITPIQFETDGEEPHSVSLKPGSYTLTETAVPAGYAQAAPINFTVEADGTIKVSDSAVTSVVMTDDYIPHDVVITKQDVNGIRLAGAQLQLTGRVTGTGSDIEAVTWTSEDAADKTIALKPGTYVLHEAAVPDEHLYLPADDITFTVALDGTVTVGGNVVTGVVMTDLYNTHPVKLRKEDPEGNLIAGAVLTVTGMEDGSEEDMAPVEITTDGTVKQLELRAGTYTLTETTTPAGYQTAEPVIFKVDALGAVTVKQGDDSFAEAEEVTVSMTDNYELHDLSVTKTVSGNMASRDKEFSFTVTFTAGTIAPLPESFNFTKGETEGTAQLNASGEYTFTLSHGETITFHDIPYGTSYEVSEADYSSEGYTTQSENRSGTVTTEDVSASFTNTRNAGVPTNVDMGKNLWLLVLILPVIVAGYALIRKKKKTV